MPVTKPDFNGLYNQMKDMPSQHINHYLLSGSPEQKLIAAMLKDEQKSKPQAQPPQGTVIDKMAQQSVAPQMPQQAMPQQAMPQQAMPQQAPVMAAEGGLMGLDTGDMFDEQSYATGGIVSFTEGGLTLEQYNALPVRDKYNYNKRLLANKNAPPNEDTTRISNTAAFLAKDAEAHKNDNFPAIQAANEAKNKIETDMALGKYDDAAKNFANRGNPNMGSGFKPFEYTPKLIDENIYSDRLKDKPTFEGIQSLAESRRNEAGINDTMFNDQRADVTKEREGVKGLKDKALWESVLMGGAKMMAGTSQYGLANLGSGIEGGLQNYIGSIKDLRAEDKLLRREENEINRADQARKEARLTNDQARYDKEDDKFTALTDKRQARVDHNIDALNSAESEGKKLNFNAEQKRWEVRTEQKAITDRTKLQSEAYTKVLGFNNKVQDTIDDYVKGRMSPTDIMVLTNSPNPSILTGKRLEIYQKALANFNKLTAEATAKYSKLPGTNNVTAMPGAKPMLPTGAKFLGFE